jgi:site-specific recombinase XerD
MRKHHPANERIKHAYLGYLKEALGQSEDSVDAVAKALSRFEEYNKHKDFKAFHHGQATGFKQHLADQVGKRSGEKFSKATLHSTLTYLTKFFQWLYREPGYKSRFKYDDADYFKLSKKDVRIACARRDRQGPTLEQVKHVLSKMATGTEIERRNRALIAFTLLAGARVGAIISMKLKHVDMEVDSVFQDAREVNTKFSKSFTTTFYPVGEEVRQIVADWVRYLREKKLWGDDDPLFPATRIEQGASLQFEVSGLERKHWSCAAPMCNIFRDAFASAGLQYFNPHSFRKTVTRLGLQLCKTPEELKAWSQNFGHEGVMTTLMSYGEVSYDRQREIIRGLATPQRAAPAIQSNTDEIAEAVFRRFRNSGVNMQTK